MSRVNLALCFLDENDQIVAKKDLNVSWNIDDDQKSSGPIGDVLVMDEVANMLNYQIEPNMRSYIRELLDIAKGK